MKVDIFVFVLFIAQIFHPVFGYKILALLPYAGKSHFDFFQPLMVGLAQSGHEVTVVSYFPNKVPVANYTDLVLDEKPILADIVNLKQIEQMHFWLRDIKLANFFVLHGLGIESCEAAFESKVVKELLRSTKKYDVILVESFVNDCMLAIAHKLNAPVIGLTSHALMPWHYRRMGTPFESSFMPNHFLGHSDQMGFYQRLNNMFHHFMFTLLHEFISQPATNRLIRKHLGDTVPPVQDLVLNTSAMLINQHFSLNGPTPYVPGIVEIGGLHIQKAKPLDDELKQVLDNAQNGAIYVSWGSMVKPETISEEKKKALVAALSQFDELILLKWPNTSIPDAPKNFYMRSWMPQRDILCHPNVKVFMSHGGLLGTTEGCHCGVAMVITPFFGDQFLNGQALQDRNAGVVLHYKDLQEENIVNAVRMALSSSMQENAKFVSESYRNRPQSPMKLAIWWIEHIIRTKGALMAVNASSRMNWIAYHNLDIYGVLLVVSLLIFKFLKCLIKKKLCSSTKKAVKQKSH